MPILVQKVLISQNVEDILLQQSLLTNLASLSTNYSMKAEAPLTFISTASLEQLAGTSQDNQVVWDAYTMVLLSHVTILSTPLASYSAQHLTKISHTMTLLTSHSCL